MDGDERNQDRDDNDPPPLHHPNPCPSQSSWGGCMPSCLQTKTSSRLFNDGTCRENVSKRVHRKCHTEACGRLSDPCHIPFVVHAIIAFRGGNSESWDGGFETLFVDAFAETLDILQTENDGYGGHDDDDDHHHHRDDDDVTNGTSLIEAGDIKILMVSPWYETEEDLMMAQDSGGTEPGGSSPFSQGQLKPIGLKVVLEISVFDDNSKVNDLNHLHSTTQMSSQEGKETLEGSRGWWKRSIFQFRNKSTTSPSECHNSDLYNLARRAHTIHDEFENDSFIKSLVDNIRMKYNTQQQHNQQAASDPSPIKPDNESLIVENSPFEALIHNEGNVDQSTVLVSWTIKTDTSGGGEVHNHALDPYLGRFDFVLVLRAYLKRLPLTALTFAAFVFFLWYCIFKNNPMEEDGEKYNSDGKGKDANRQVFRKHIRNTIAKCPNPYNCLNPVEVVKRQFGNTHYMGGVDSNGDIKDDRIRRRYRGGRFKYSSISSRGVDTTDTGPITNVNLEYANDRIPNSSNISSKWTPSIGDDSTTTDGILYYGSKKNSPVKPYENAKYSSKLESIIRK